MVSSLLCKMQTALLLYKKIISACIHHKSSWAEPKLEFSWHWVSNFSRNQDKVKLNLKLASLIHISWSKIEWSLWTTGHNNTYAFAFWFVDISTPLSNVNFSPIFQNIPSWSTFLEKYHPEPWHFALGLPGLFLTAFYLSFEKIPVYRWVDRQVWI